MRITLYVLCLLLYSRDMFAQTLLWDVVEDLSGGTDMARAITLTEKSAVVIGNASDSAESVDDFVIQSLRRTNGSVRWTDPVPEAPSLLTAVQIASAQGRVFASGYASGATVGSTDIVVRGYDAFTGTLLWNSVWDTGRDDFPQGIVAGPGAVVVVGYGGDSAGHALNFIVRAYDPLTGAVLWEDRVERQDLDAAAWNVAITRNRVVVAGTVTTTSSARDLLVRAYNAASGALDWEITRPSTNPETIKALAGRVFLAGSSSNHSYVGAFDARSGALLWEDEATDPSSSFRDIAVDGNRVVAVGSSGSALLVRAYDVGGVMEWEARTSVPPGYSDSGITVALNSTVVYVGGNSSQDFVYSEMLVQSYDAATGTLLWDDRSHRSATPTTAVDMALGKNRLFVAGYTSGVGTDFVIRAYDVRNDGTGHER